MKFWLLKGGCELSDLLWIVGGEDIAWCGDALGLDDAEVLDMEIVEKHVELEADAFQDLRTMGSRGEDECCLADVEGVADGIVKSVDEGGELCTDTIEIDGRGEDEYVGLCHGEIDFVDVVVLDAMVAVGETGVAALARGDIEVGDRERFDKEVFWDCFCECFSERGGVAIFSRAAFDDEYRFHFN